MAQSIPPSVFFEREGKAGRRLYGAFSAVTWVCGAIVVLASWTEAVPEAVFDPALWVGLLTVTICTFCAMFGVAKR